MSENVRLFAEYLAHYIGRCVLFIVGFSLGWVAVHHGLTWCLSVVQ